VDQVYNVRRYTGGQSFGDGPIIRTYFTLDRFMTTKGATRHGCTVFQMKTREGGRLFGVVTALSTKGEGRLLAETGRRANLAAQGGLQEGSQHGHTDCT